MNNTIWKVHPPPSKGSVVWQVSSFCSQPRSYLSLISSFAYHIWDVEDHRYCTWVNELWKETQKQNCTFRGLYYQPKQCNIIKKILQNDHTVALFDSPQMGNFMFPDLCLWNFWQLMETLSQTVSTDTFDNWNLPSPVEVGKLSHYNIVSLWNNPHG